MGGLVTAFRTLLGGNPLDGVKQMVEEFHLSPEQKAQIQAAVAAQEVQKEQIAAARDQAITEIQSQNIRAETTSEDAYVRRARPTFLYMMIAAMAVDLMIFPLINLWTGRGLTIIEIPAAYLELFGVGFLGYTGARTWEKVQGVSDDKKKFIK